MSENDSSFVFVPIRDLQKMRGMIDPSTGAGMINQILIKLKPGVNGDLVRDKLKTVFPDTLYSVQTWRDRRSPLLAAVQLETTILNVLLFAIIAVAGFGILAIFYMIVVEKTRDIGILKSLGASRGGVMGIFLAYGLLLGLVGSGAGLAIGLLFVHYINPIADFLGWIRGMPVFDPTIYYFNKIPTSIVPHTVICIVLGAVAIAVAASILPARRAARLHPVEALRMSDDLERILHEKKSRRPTPINPQVHAMPRVHGGQPLQGGPKLDIPFSWDAAAEDEESETAQPRSTPEAALVQDRPALFTGPHFSLPQEEEIEDIETSVTIIPTPKPTEPAYSAPPEKLNEHLRAANLHKSYRKGSTEVPVLRGVDIKIHQGEFLAIEGQSGSGKSTLLHLMGTLDSPNKGEIYFHGRRIDNLPVQARDAIRNQRIGMIFQFYHLLPELSTLENVLAPLMIAEGVWSYWKQRRKFHETAKSILELVGLSHRLKHKPRELSGGEMQRAAIARALIAQPELILADEPTGNLDQGTGQEILKILRTLNEQQNLTIVMVTHDQSLARQADRIVRLKGGVIQE